MMDRESSMKENGRFRGGRLLKRDILEPDTEGNFDSLDSALVDLLSRGKFIPRSEFRSRLRNRLHARQATGEAMANRRAILVSNLLQAFVTASIVAVMTLAVAFVAAPDVAGQGYQVIVRFVRVNSPLALLQRTPPELPAPTLPVPPHYPAALGSQPRGAAIPTFPPPADPQAESISQPRDLPSTMPIISLADAEANLNLNIRMPSWLPADYTIEGVMSPPALPQGVTPPSGTLIPDRPEGLKEISTPLAVTVIFRNTNGDLLFLSEMVLPQRQTTNAVELPAVKSRVEDITIKGQPGQYLERKGDHRLHWESSDGFLYDLSSPSLSGKDLLQIARSIR